MTPLYFAAQNGSEEIVRLLLERGADPNAMNKDGTTPSMYAIRAGNRAILDMLSERGGVVAFEVSALGGTRHSIAASGPRQEPLDWAALDERDIRAFVQGGGDVNRRDKDHATALMSAVAMGAASLVRELLARNADVNAQDDEGHTALMIAACIKAPVKTQIVADLLAHHADVNRQKKDGWTALMFAAARNQPEIVQTLLARGANPNLQDAQGMTALMLVRLNGFLPVVRMLERPPAPPVPGVVNRWTALPADAAHAAGTNDREASPSRMQPCKHCGQSIPRGELTCHHCGYTRWGPLVMVLIWGIGCLARAVYGYLKLQPGVWRNAVYWGAGLGALLFLLVSAHSIVVAVKTPRRR